MVSARPALIRQFLYISRELIGSFVRKASICDLLRISQTPIEASSEPEYIVWSLQNKALTGPSWPTKLPTLCFSLKSHSLIVASSEALRKVCSCAFAKLPTSLKCSFAITFPCFPPSKSHISTDPSDPPATTVPESVLSRLNTGWSGRKVLTCVESIQTYLESTFMSASAAAVQ